MEFGIILKVSIPSGCFCCSPTCTTRCTGIWCIYQYIWWPLIRISLCCSIYLVISVAIERLSAVCNPLAYRCDLASGNIPTWRLNSGSNMPRNSDLSSTFFPALHLHSRWTFPGNKAHSLPFLAVCCQDRNDNEIVADSLRRRLWSSARTSPVVANVPLIPILCKSTLTWGYCAIY